MILARLVLRNLGRRPMRTALTAGGVAAALVILTLSRSFADGLDDALAGTDAARSLIVYRKNRYCPQTSFLPESYAPRIARVPGVVSVLPVKVFLNNCRASLDLVAFQGAPADLLFAARDVRIVAGSAEAFRRDRDSALLGRAFAARKGVSVGDRFRFGAIDVKVAGVFASEEPVEEGVVLTHLEYLQRAGPVDRLGTVTQFEVKVDDARRAPEVARAIDDLLRTAEPTDTRAKTAFLESATKDLREILRFMAALGAACVAATLALVANAVAISVDERTAEFGVLRALGYRARHVLGLVLAEGATLALAGGVLGAGAAFALLGAYRPAFGAEGVSVAFSADPRILAEGLAAALLTGVVAGLFPAIRAARISVASAVRGG